MNSFTAANRIYNYKFINKKDVSKRSSDSVIGKYITKLFFTYLLLTVRNITFRTDGTKFVHLNTIEWKVIY